MKLLTYLLFLSLPAFADVACNNNSGDPGLLQTAANAGGTIVVSNTCALGSTTVNLNTGVTLHGPANINMNAGSTAFSVNSDSVNINNITFNGGAAAHITSPGGDPSNHRSGFQFIANTVNNLNGQTGIEFDPILVNSAITFNTFFNGFIASDNWMSDPSTWSGGIENTSGSAIVGTSGMSNVQIENNVIDLMPNDAIHVGANLITQSRYYFAATNNSISYNRFTRIHRIAIENQGNTNYTQCSGSAGDPATNTPGTPPNCTNPSITAATNTKQNGNYISSPIWPYYNTFCLSLVDGWDGQYYNNSCVLNGGVTNASTFIADVFEVAGSNKKFQGNVGTSDTIPGVGSGNTPGWGGGFALGTPTYPTSWTWSFINNIMAGPSMPANIYQTDSFNCVGGPACPGSAVTQVKTSNYTSDPAPNTGHLNVPAMNFTLVSSPTSGGVQTFNYSVISTLSIKWVQWTIDGNPTTLQTQELSDVSNTFNTDRLWLYHIPITLSSYAGTHSLTATATDVSGLVRQVTTNFTGSAAGAGITFNPSAGLAFGNTNVTVAATPQTMNIQNTGTTSITSLVLSSIGTNASDFVLSSNTCGSTLTAGSSCSVVVTFTPSAAGSRSATLNVANSLAGSPQTLPLTGTGTNPSVGIFTNGDFSTGSLSPQTYSSSQSTAVVDTVGGCGGGNNVDIIFTADNSGNSELIFPNLTLPPNGTLMQLSFFASSVPGRQINVLASQNVSPFTNYGIGTGFTGYQPTLTGTCTQYTTNFTVSNSPTAGGAQVAVQLNGSLNGDRYHFAKFVLQQLTGMKTASLLSSTVAFGAVSVSTPKTASLVLQNTGTQTVTLSSITVTGTNASDFAQSNSCGSSLAPGTSCPLNLTFTPSALGARTATLTVNDDSTNGPHVATLTGSGSNLVVTKQDYLTHSTVRLTVSTSLLLVHLQTAATVAPASCTGGAGLLQPMQIKSSLAGNVAAGAPLIVNVTGLQASTTYNICVRGTADGTTYIDSPTVMVTTLRLPAVHPAPPVPPKTFDPGKYPDTSGYTVVTVASDCHDLGTLYTAAVARQATTGTVINDNSGVCASNGSNLHFSLKPVDVQNWPPAGVNLSDNSITLGGTPTLTVGQGVRFGFNYKAFQTYPTSNSCPMNNGLVSGQVYYVSSVINSATNRVTLACNVNNMLGPQLVFTDQGTDTAPGAPGFNWVPEVRTNKWIIYRAGASDNNLPPPGTGMRKEYVPNLTTLTSQLANINVVGINGAVVQYGNGSGDAGNIENLVDHIWLGPGFEINTQVSPTAGQTFDPKPYQYLIYIVPTASNIVIERNYIHYPGTPTRTRLGIEADGYNIAIKNNYVDNALYYHPVTTGSALTITSGTTMTQAAGTVNYGTGTISVPGHTITIAGSGSGRIFTGLNPLSSNVYTVWTTTGLSATCSPSCVNTNIGAAGGPRTGFCDATDQWPQTSNGEPAAGPQGCATYTTGALTGVQAPFAVTGIDSQYWSEGTQFLINGNGPGPFNAFGNKISGVGIMAHEDDSGGSLRDRGDYSWLRNYFEAPFQYLYGSPTSDGLNYRQRQPHEIKSGYRTRVDGETIDGNWVGQEGSSNGLLLTSVNGQGITDIDITNNMLMHGPGGFASACDVTPGGDFNLTPPCLRWRYVNNLSWDIDARYADPLPFGEHAQGWLHEGPNSVEDMIETNNTTILNNGSLPVAHWLFDSTTEGFTFANNIINIEPTYQGFGLDSSSQDGPCSGMIGQALWACKFTNSTFFNNLLVGNGQTPSSVAAAWPSSKSYFQSGSTSSIPAIGFYNYQVPTFTNGNPQDQDFDLIDAAQCKAGSSTSNDHSQDCGINANQLRSHLGVVKLFGASGITSTGFTVEYQAPDVGQMYIDVCPAADTNCITPIQRFTDSSSAVYRTWTFTGLTTKTFYNFAVRAAGNPVHSIRLGQVWTR